MNSVYEHKSGKMAIGTRASEIIEIDTNKRPKVLLRGHFEGELKGLCCHPRDNVFFTVG